MRARREPRRLDGRLAELDRLGHAALHLVRVALDEPDGDEQPSLARGAGDRDAAVRVRGGVVVVLEVVLRPAEVVQRLEPGRQLGVRHAVDEGGRLLAVLARGVDLSRGGLAERQRRRGGRDQGAVAGRARRREGPAAHRDRLLEVELVEAVHRQLDLQRGGRRRRAGRPARPRRAPAARGPPRAGRASARSPRSARSGRRGAPPRRRAAVPAPPGASRGSARARPSDRSVRARSTRTSTCRSRSSAGSSRSAASNQWAATAGARGAVSAPAFEQQRDGLLVARARGVLDVVRALGRRGASGGQRGRGPGVRRELPAARRRLEDRAAHERVAEDEAPRHRGRAHEIERQEPVERREPLGRGQLRDRRREAGLERLAGDGGGIQQRALLPRQGCELPGERRRDGGRDPVALAVAVRRRGDATLPRRRARAARGRTGCRRRGGRWPRPLPVGDRRAAPPPAPR